MMQDGHKWPNFSPLTGFWPTQSCAGLPEQGKRHLQLPFQPGQGVPDRKEKKSLPPLLQTWVPLVSGAQPPKIGSMTPKLHQTKQKNRKQLLFLVGGRKKSHSLVFIFTYYFCLFNFFFIFTSLANAEKEHVLGEGASLSSSVLFRIFAKLALLQKLFSQRAINLNTWPLLVLFLGRRHNLYLTRQKKPHLSLI